MHGTTATLRIGEPLRAAPQATGKPAMRLIFLPLICLGLLSACGKDAAPVAPLEAGALAPAPPALKGNIASIEPSVPGLDALKAEKAARRAAGEIPPGHPQVGGAQNPAAAHPAVPAQPSPPIEPVAKADHTIAEVRAQRKALAGKAFEVRGRVVKVNTAIMGKTWLHLRDGSGEGELTVTTAAAATRGDLVTVRGKLAIDRDIGSGYKFDILLEDAAVTVEEPASAAPAAAPAVAPAH